MKAGRLNSLVVMGAKEARETNVLLWRNPVYGRIQHQRHHLRQTTDKGTGVCNIQPEVDSPDKLQDIFITLLLLTSDV
jgi:hypothetical protein